MTEHGQISTQASLHGMLSDAAGDFFPGTAPYDAIVGEARRRVRLRVAGGSALSLVAIGAAVAVGVSSFGGVAGHASAPTGPAAGGIPQAVPPVVATTTAAVKEDHYGKAVIAQGDFEGTHWTLSRDLHLQENGFVPPTPNAGNDATPTKGPWAFDDVYVTGPNGLRDRAAGGGSTAPGHLAEILNHFGRPDADVVASAVLTALGTGTLDDSRNKEKASPYGIYFLSGIVSSKVARVQVVLADGTPRDAKLVPAPAGEDGQYFYLPIKNSSRQVSGQLAFYDSQGHILQSRCSRF
jgi:hypothetical protein